MMRGERQREAFMMRANEGCDVGAEHWCRAERKMLTGLPAVSKISDEQNLCSVLHLLNFHTNQTE
jgi:hypothetical protein